MTSTKNDQVRLAKITAKHPEAPLLVLFWLIGAGSVTPALTPLSLAEHVDQAINYVEGMYSDD